MTEKDENDHFTHISADDVRFKPIMQREQAWYVVGEMLMKTEIKIRKKQRKKETNKQKWKNQFKNMKWN